jgi:hypothetical protein
VQEMHDVPMVGHHRERTIRATLSKNLYWHKMKEVAEHYVCTCVKYRSTKLMNKKKYGLYGALHILISRYEGVSMEFMTCFLELQGQDTILVVVNEFSKLIKFEPTKATISNIIRLFIDMLVKHNGMPKVTMLENSHWNFGLLIL